jgi:hypothetical protein
MSMTISSQTTFKADPCYLQVTPYNDILRDTECVNLFDQNGYHLTRAEQAFLEPNGYAAIERRHEDCMRHAWIVWDKRDGAHINHSDLFERKGFDGDALAQLKLYANHNPMLYKLIKMKPKWGIDISIDYVSEDAVFEVFHYEWDAFEFDQVLEKKHEIETYVISQDWDDIAIQIWSKRHEWFHLDFFGQSKWRTDYLGLSPEKFKNIIWDDK